jgi:hypothetical protein
MAGFIGFRALRERSFVQVRLLELHENINWRALVAPLLWACHDVAKGLPVRRPMEAPRGVELFLGQGHPFLAVLGSSLAHHQPRAYAWYVRVADLPRFIRHIASVLEARLAASNLAGYSGDLFVDFYSEGLHIGWERGRMMVAERWRRPHWEQRPYACFPDRTFLKLLFGYQSLQELFRAYPDVWGHEESLLLLETLFPNVSGFILPLD